MFGDTAWFYHRSKAGVLASQLVHWVTKLVWNKPNRTRRLCVTSGQIKSEEDKNVPGINLIEKSRYGVFVQENKCVRGRVKQVKFCRLSQQSNIFCDEISSVMKCLPQGTGQMLTYINRSRQSSAHLRMRLQCFQPQF